MSLVQMSISAGLLVIAIVLIRAVALNRLPKTTFLILWGVALFRLLIPVTIPARFGLYPALRELWDTVLSANTVPSVSENTLTWFVISETAAGVAVQNGAEQVISIPPANILWLIGMVTLIIFFAVLYFKSHRPLRFATLICDDDFVSEWLATHRIMRPLAIVQSDRILTPLAAGLIKPRIILPKCMDLSDRELLSHVLTHEYYHIKRFDALWKLLLVLAVCIHWFNPLVWVMFVLASRDLELTCDELVIRHFGAEKKAAYAYSIIGMAEQRSKFASLLYNGFSKNAAVERIESIMKMKRKSIISLSVAVVMVTVLAIGTLTAFATTTDGSANERLQPQPFPTEERNFTFENPEMLDELIEKFLEMPLQEGMIRLIPGNPEGMRSFESLEALSEYLGVDVEFTFAPTEGMRGFESLEALREYLDGDAELFSLAHIEGMRSLNIADSDAFARMREALDSEHGIIRIFPGDTTGFQGFESWDALYEYMGGELTFIPANQPLRYNIDVVGDFVIYWQSEQIDLLGDQEIYVMIQDGASMDQVMAVLRSR